MSEINQLNVDNTVYDLQDKRNDWTNLPVSINTDTHTATIDISKLESLLYPKMYELLIYLGDSSNSKITRYYLTKVIANNNKYVRLQGVSILDLTVSSDKDALILVNHTSSDAVKVKYRLID